MGAVTVVQVSGPLPVPPEGATLALWERLCALLDEDPQLWPAVRQALLDPASSFAEHAEALADRGIEDPAAIDPWVTLVDGLDDAGALAYLDRADQGSELADALAGIPRVRAAGVDLGPVTDTDGDVPTAVRAADAALAPAGLCLVYLDEDSDAYPLVVVRADDAAEIASLAEQLGHDTTLR